MKVLVVDDDPGVRTVIGEMLERLGHEPTLADDGRAALEALDLHPLRVVITDWMMEGMDGPELIRRIRAAGRQRYVYIIMLTARGGSDSYLEGMRAGADDFVTKPVPLAELEARLIVAERIVALQENMRLLEGLLPICMYCKRIRGTDQSWTTVERYVEERSDASFSHDVCPACYDARVVPQLRSPESPPRS